MLGSRAPWVVPAIGPGDQQFEGYPDEAISEWHERLGAGRRRPMSPSACLPQDARACLAARNARVWMPPWRALTTIAWR